MKAVVYKGNGQISLEERPMPELLDARDAIVKVTLTTICSSDIHIKHGAVPRAVPGTILGHEFVGEVVETGSAVNKVKPGDRVSVNVETFCGECFFCKRGFVNNCADEHGGVDGSYCQEIMDLTACGKLDAGFLITHRCRLEEIMDAYNVFENKKDHVIKYAVRP